MKIPVIINNRNLLTWTREMINKIKTLDNVGDIIIVDNDSSYQPLLNWYKSKPCDIVFCNNLGYTGAWLSGVVDLLNTDFYVVSDPDLGINDIPKDTLTYLDLKMNELKLDKIGLGLNSELVLKNHPYFNHIENYEKKRYLNSRLISDIYIDVATDTTFALYSKKTHYIGGGSTSFPYIAKHYPWYYSKEDVKNNEEFLYYIYNANSSASCKSFLI